MKSESNKVKIKKFRFVVCSALILFSLIFYRDGIFARLMCKMKGYIYMEPSMISIILFVLTMAVYMIYSVHISNGRVKKRKKEWVKAAVVCVITGMMVFVNFISINYLDSDRLYCDGTYYSDSEVDLIEVQVRESSVYLDAKGYSPQYDLYCKIEANAEKIIFLSSQNFLSYEELYKYLLRMKDKVRVEKRGFSDLINYEEKRLFSQNKDKNITYIKLIENLA